MKNSTINHKVSDTINHPSHYIQGCSPIGRKLLIKHLYLTDYDLSLECIEFLERDYRFCSFHLGNAIKYLWRSGLKGDANEDLRKALWYLRRARSRKVKNFNDLFASMFMGARRRDLFDSSLDRLANAIELLIEADRQSVEISGIPIVIV